MEQRYAIAHFEYCVVRRAQLMDGGPGRETDVRADTVSTAAKVRTIGDSSTGTQSMVAVSLGSEPYHKEDTSRILNAYRNIELETACIRVRMSRMETSVASTIAWTAPHLCEGNLTLLAGWLLSMRAQAACEASESLRRTWIYTRKLSSCLLFPAVHSYLSCAHQMSISPFSHISLDSPLPQHVFDTEPYYVQVPAGGGRRKARMEA